MARFIKKKTNNQINKFNKTNLDLENPKPLGGPNRTNSYNIPTGQYITPKTWNAFGWTFKGQEPGGALKDLDGKDIKTQLHQWTSKNKYIDQFIGKTTIPPPPSPSPPPKTPEQLRDIQITKDLETPITPNLPTI